MKPQTERKIAGFLRNGAVYIYVGIQVVSIIVILGLIVNNRHNDYTIVWMLVIFLLPVFGQILYLLWGSTGSHGKQSRKIRSAIARSAEFIPHNADAIAALEAELPGHKRISKYLAYKGFPVYRNTVCRYFPLGELQFDAMLADIEKAEKFVFVEYFILQGGRLWDRFEDILTRKAAEGVEIRLMYDDMGSVMTIPKISLRI